jgi:protein LTV1
MKEMGEGQFYSSSGRFENQTNNALLKKIELPEDVLPSTIENDRLLEAITLTTDLMDEDLREALINDEAFELLDDDFMLQATSIDKTNTNQQEDGFDYDAHIAKLIMATTATNIKNTHTKLTDDDRKEEEEEDHCTDYEEEEEEDQQRLLDEMFEKTLAFEYED